MSVPPVPERAARARFRKRVLAHYAAHQRALPWRTPRPDPYAIWVCEIMAQQTQIERVVVYWTRWMARFPSVRALAEAPLADVLAHWSGLGYYSRARALHRAAGEIMARHDGVLPADLDALQALPGIGPYTAGAIASIAFGLPAAAVDGNVIRVLARAFGVTDDVRTPAGARRIRALAEALVPKTLAGDFNQGLFDLGATVCTPRRPACERCPLADDCVARDRGTQDALPRLTRKTKVSLVDVDALLVRRGLRVLLARRAPTGLYGGLWELPEASAYPGAVVDRGQVLAEHLHKLTHRTRHHRVFAATLDAAAASNPGPPYDTARFTLPDELSTLGVSSATAILVAHLTDHPELRWPRPKPPAPSSPKATRRSSRA